MNQKDELLLLVSRLKNLSIEVPNQLQVCTVIAKLPFVNDFRKKLLHAPKISL